MRFTIISDNVQVLKQTQNVFCEFLPCNYRRQTRYRYRKLLEQSEACLQLNISIMGQYQGVGGVAELRCSLSAIAVHPNMYEVLFPVQLKLLYSLQPMVKEHRCCASQSSIDTDQTEPLSAKLLDSNFKIVVPRAVSVSS